VQSEAIHGPPGSIRGHAQGVSNTKGEGPLGGRGKRRHRGAPAEGCGSGHTAWGRVNTHRWPLGIGLGSLICRRFALAVSGAGLSFAGCVRGGWAARLPGPLRAFSARRKHHSQRTAPGAAIETTGAAQKRTREKLPPGDQPGGSSETEEGTPGACTGSGGAREPGGTSAHPPPPPPAAPPPPPPPPGARPGGAA
jgi:hypothetical protein